MAALDRIWSLPTRRPRSVLGALLGLVLAGAAVLALRGVRLEFGVEQFVAQSDPLFERYQELNQRFGRDDNTAFVFATHADWCSSAGLALALELTEALADSELVDEVLSPATVTLILDDGARVYLGPALTRDRVRAFDDADRERLRRQLTREPLYAGRVLSTDGRTACFAVRVDERFYGGRYHRQVVAHVESVLSRFEARGLEFLVSGGPSTQDAYRRFLLRDARVFVSVTILLLGLALFVTFRTLQGVLLPLAGVGLALYFTFVFLSAAGIPVNLLSSAIPVLVLIVGISDAIHLLTRYAEELALGQAQPEALSKAVRVTARACLLTSITTSVGFFVLPSTGIPMLADMGIVTGAGVLIAYATSLTLLPALASLLPPPPPLPVAGPGGRLHRIGAWAMDRPAAVAGGLVALLGVTLVVAIPRLRVESRVVDDLPRDHPTVQTRDAIERRMGGNFPLTFLLPPRQAGEEPLDDPVLIAKLARFQQALLSAEASGDAPYLSGALSAVDLLGLAWRELGGAGLPDSPEALAQVRLFLGDDALAEVWDPESGLLRVQLRVYDRGTHATFAFLERAQALFRAQFGPEAELEVQGFTYLAHRTHREIVWSSMTSFSLDFAIVALLVALLFRSLRLTVLAILPNVFPLLCTLGFMGLAGVDLRISSAIVFSIVFGIAVDDTVHFLARYHEERAAGLSPREAASHTIQTTGRAMLFMAFVLAAGFAVLVFSAFAPNRVLGLLMAVTVASGAVGDLVLLPALLVLGQRTGTP